MTNIGNASELLDQLKKNKVNVMEMETTLSNNVCVECSSQNIDNDGESYAFQSRKRMWKKN